MLDIGKSTTKPFIYNYKDQEGSCKNVSLDIRIPYDDCLDELVTQVLSKMDPMMRFLDENAG